jgi:uncharacterized protein (DUF433 family)
LRELPSVEELAGGAAAGALLEEYPRAQVIEAIRTVIETARMASIT